MILHTERALGEVDVELVRLASAGPVLLSTDSLELAEAAKKLYGAYYAPLYVFVGLGFLVED